MTPLPKKKRSKGRQTNRKLAFSYKLKSMNKCLNCNELVIPHTVCRNCGYYRGREVVKQEDKTIIRKVQTTEN